MHVLDIIKYYGFHGYLTCYFLPYSFFGISSNFKFSDARTFCIWSSPPFGIKLDNLETGTLTLNQFKELADQLTKELLYDNRN